MDQKRIFVVGGNGQLGMALRKAIPEAKFVDRDEFDMTDDSYYRKENWSKYDTIINAAAYTAVDEAETTNGRRSAWRVNASAIGKLVRTANEHDLTLVHVSSDYVFDGSKELHTEDELLSPLSVYGQTKAAGDIAASIACKRYILRTSWVMGEGKNFVLTMKGLAEKDVKPKVVDDQFGRVTFAADLASAIVFILREQPKYGVYNFSNDGKPVAWSDIAKKVFEFYGKSASDVTGVSTEEYFSDRSDMAPRPKHSSFSLEKIKMLGFKPEKWEDALEEYLKELK